MAGVRVTQLDTAIPAQKKTVTSDARHVRSAGRAVAGSPGRAVVGVAIGVLLGESWGSGRCGACDTILTGRETVHNPAPCR